MKRRVIQLIGPVLILVGAIWAAVALAETTVEIETQRGETKVVDISTIGSPDVNNVNYKIGDEYIRITGVSLNKVLAQIGIKNWTSVTIEGITVTFDSYRQKKPPVFYIPENSDDEVVFVKPKGPDGPAIKKRSGAGNLDMDFQVPLEYHIEGTPKSGETVTFSVSVPDGGAQNAYEFTWSSNTAGSGTGNKFEVTFPDTGGEVTVNMTAKRDGRTVGTRSYTTEKLDPKPQDTGGTGGIGGTGTGTYGSGLGTGGYTYPDTTYPSTEPNFPDIPTDTPDVKTPKVPETPTGESVKGELLSLDTPAPSTPGQPAPEASPATPEPDMTTADDNDKPAEITGPGAVIGAGVIFTLLGLGAGREFETFSPKQMMRRPDFNRLRRIAFPRWK